MLALIEQNRSQIELLCRRNAVQRLELFGSAARGAFDPQTSDLDFFAEFEDLGWKDSSRRYFGLLHGLEDLLHVRIDLVDRSAIENHHFLEMADRDRALIYAAPVAKAS
jgi:uncharacterized protein